MHAIRQEKIKEPPKSKLVAFLKCKKYGALQFLPLILMNGVTIKKKAPEDRVGPFVLRHYVLAESSLSTIDVLFPRGQKHRKVFKSSLKTQKYEEPKKDISAHSKSIWMISMNAADLKNSKYSCPLFAKSYSCKHVFGFQIR